MSSRTPAACVPAVGDVLELECCGLASDAGRVQTLCHLVLAFNGSWGVLHQADMLRLQVDIAICVVLLFRKFGGARCAVCDKAEDTDMQSRCVTSLQLYYSLCCGKCFSYRMYVLHTFGSLVTR